MWTSIWSRDSWSSVLRSGRAFLADIVQEACHSLDWDLVEDWSPVTFTGDQIEYDTQTDFARAFAGEDYAAAAPDVWSHHGLDKRPRLDPTTESALFFVACRLLGVDPSPVSDGCPSSPADMRGPTALPVALTSLCRRQPDGIVPPDALPRLADALRGWMLHWWRTPEAELRRSLAPRWDVTTTAR